MSLLRSKERWVGSIGVDLAKVLILLTIGAKHLSERCLAVKNIWGLCAAWFLRPSCA